MPTHWQDVSIPVGPGTVVWPGDPIVEMGVVARIAHGDVCNVSSLRLGTHTGTHVDAPWHFEEDRSRLGGVDTRLFFGEALLIDLTDAALITAADLPSAPLPTRVVFKTRNSDRPLTAPFSADYVAVDATAARRLVDDGVRLVGIDALSIAPFEQPGDTTHHILLQNDVLIVEGLRLAGLKAGEYPFVVLPLSVPEADGAPARAFIGVKSA